MANHIEHLAAEAAVTAGSLKVLLLTDLASVDEVSLAASSRVADVDDSDLLLLASATGRGRLDVLEDLADVEPTALSTSTRLVLPQSWSCSTVDSTSGKSLPFENSSTTRSMERTSPHLQDAGADYLGPEGETRALVEVLRARVRAGRA